MNKLIVNADDLGLSIGTNIGIVTAIERGIVTSTSIMACGQAFDDACRRLKAIDEPCVGVHLVLDEEYSILPAEQIPSIVTADGKFFDRGLLLKKLLFSKKISLLEVYNEFNAQIKKCIDGGISISHLNGHGHVHVYPKIVSVICQLAAEYNIPYVRMPSEKLTFVDFSDFNIKKLINKYIVTIFALLAKSQFQKASIRFPQYFWGMLYGGNLNRNKLHTLLNKISNDGLSEIMCHPGDEDSERDHCYRNWDYHWQEEYAALLTHNDNTLKQNYKIDLTSFSKLKL